LPLEITCGSCGASLYNGYELKTAKEVLRTNQSKCRNCGKALSDHDYAIGVLPFKMGNE
jgi:hypothetical protein